MADSRDGGYDTDARAERQAEEDLERSLVRSIVHEHCY